MFDTIFDGNEIQDYKKGISESMQLLELCLERGCTDDRCAMDKRIAGQGRNVGFQPELPWPRPDHRHRAGQVCGALFRWMSPTRLYCVIRNF